MQTSNMQTLTYPYDEVISFDLYNLGLSFFEQVPLPMFHEYPTQGCYAPMEPDFVFDNDVNEIATETCQDVKISTKSASAQLIFFLHAKFSNCRGKASEKREWGTFRLLAEDKIRRSTSSARPPLDSSLSVDGSQAQVELESTNRSSMRNLDGDEAPVRADCRRTPKSLSPSSTLKKSSRPSKRYGSSRRTRGSARSRNVQASINEAEGIEGHLSGRVRGQKSTNVCPISGCGYRQGKSRKPDLKRHIRTHFRSTVDIRCTHVLTEHGMWIGGCLATFSRKDALQRHLRENRICAPPRPFPRLF